MISHILTFKETLGQEVSPLEPVDGYAPSTDPYQRSILLIRTKQAKFGRDIEGIPPITVQYVRLTMLITLSPYILVCNMPRSFLINPSLPYRGSFPTSSISSVAHKHNTICFGRGYR